MPENKRIKGALDGMRGVKWKAALCASAKYYFRECTVEAERHDEEEYNVQAFGGSSSVCETLGSSKEPRSACERSQCNALVGKCQGG